MEKCWYKHDVHTSYGKSIPDPYDVDNQVGKLSVPKMQMALSQASARNKWTIAFVNAVVSNGIERIPVTLRREMESCICRMYLPNGRWIDGRMFLRKYDFSIIKRKGNRKEIVVEYNEVIEKSIRFNDLPNGSKRLSFKVEWS